MKTQSEELKTKAVMVIRGMHGRSSSMGKPVSSRPNEPRSTLKNLPAPAVSEFTCSCSPGWTGPTCEISEFFFLCFVFLIRS